MSEPTADARFVIPREVLGGARRRAGLPALPDGEPWPVCRAPEHLLVLDAGAGLRGCEFAAAQLLPTTGEPEALAFRDGPLQSLRERLAAGDLAAAHCRTCAWWAQAGVLEAAPCVRDYGNLPPREDGNAPGTLVVNVPADGLAPAARQLLTGLLPRLERLVVEQPAVPSRADEPWLAVYRDAAANTLVTLRVQEIGSCDAALVALQGVRVDTIEIALDHGTSVLASARELAERLGAALTARFVLTPANWFRFEDIALACAELDVPLAIALIARGGSVPLAALAIEDLAFVKNVLASAGPRFAAEWPDSLATRILAGLVTALRALLDQATQHALQAAPEAAAAGLDLPPLDHSWHLDDRRLCWWLEQLFGHSHAHPVRKWLVDLLAAAGGAAALLDHPWLRLLCQKLAWEKRQPEVLRALQATYGPDPAERQAHLAAEAELAARLDLTPFGGPWSALLGLHHGPRAAPFAIGPALPATIGEPRVTVLIPSYQHAGFIADAIRSVLAQTAADFRLLVVDDRSPDDTAGVARQISDPRLEVRVNAENMGLGNSVLAALSTIDTPYVALLNSDDVFHPERLARCLEALDADPAVQVVATGLALLDQDGTELTPQNVSLVLDGQQIYSWVHWFHGAQPGSIVPERLFAELLGRNFLATSSNIVARCEWLRGRAAALQHLKYCLDWQVFLQAAIADGLHCIPLPLAGYRLHKTNTVWFDEQTRRSFFLEVNRVIAQAVGDLIRRHGDIDEELAVRVATILLEFVATNREAFGLALFLTTIMDPVALDRLAALSPRLQLLLDGLRGIAAAELAFRDAASNAPDSRALADSRRLLLADLRRERAVEERFVALERMQELLAQVRAMNTRLQEGEERRQSLRASLDEAAARNQSLDQRCRALVADLSRLQAELAATRETLRGEIAGLEAQLQTTATYLRESQQSLDAERRALAETRDHAAALQQTIAARDSQLQEHGRRIDALSGQLLERESQVRFLERHRQALLRQTSDQANALHDLRTSREYRSGNFLWNKLPLGYMSRIAIKVLNRLRSATSRLSLWTQARLQRSKAEGVAVVASCWHWPIYSHTFVYQEMIALRQMGLEVKMFHWGRNDDAQLQPAFAYLHDTRVELKPDLKQHRRDRDHFEQKYPGRLAALLAKIAEATGRNVADLQEEPLVLRACTFARMAELAGARYLHSYFFYDQAFMVFVASWLLGIPRGVSCYADHMLADFPLKLVPLQLQHAAVIVATSSRIRNELIAIGGPECADRIVVKPNGVNGERFPAVDRGERRPGDTFEVISISRLEPKKGLEYLVDAVEELKRRGRKITAHVVGAVDKSLQISIDYGARLAFLIQEKGLENEILLHGMMVHEQIVPIMRRCRAFVAPYVELESGDKDGIPTAMLEALASGLPVVTTDSGSILEVVTDGVQALVVPQRNSKAYADALDRLIADPALERRLARAARQRFDEAFDIKVTERILHERIAAVLREASPRTDG